jgi:hypothetical protein
MSADGDAAGSGIPPEEGKPSGAVEVSAPQSTDSAKDEEALISVLKSEFAGKANNGALRKALGWEQDRYFAARNRLLDKGQVQKAHGGPGGATVLVVQLETVPAAVAATPEPPPPSGEDTYENEAALYPPMLRQIESVWVKEEGYDSWLCRQTALAGRRVTGGKWTRPDITVVAVQKFKFLRDPIFDVISFEIKPRENISVDGVFEALAHRQYTTRAYVIFHIGGEKFENEPEKNRIEALAEQNGIGLILAEDPQDYETWIERVRARRWLPQLSPHFFAGQNATGDWRFAATILA